MALTFDIGCGDETHEIEFEWGKPPLLKNHNVEMLQAFTAFGAEKPECLWWLEHWNRVFDGRGTRTPVAQLRDLLDESAFARLFMEALPWNFKLDDFAPEGEVDCDDLLQALARLLEYQFERDPVAVHITARRIYSVINALPGEWEEYVQFGWNRYDEETTETSSEASILYELSIAGVYIARWQVTWRRDLLEPIWFTTTVENVTEQDRASGHEVAVTEMLDALTLVEEDAPEPQPPELDTPKPCDGSMICNYALLFSRLINNRIDIVPYRTLSDADYAADYAKAWFEQYGMKSEYSISLLRRREEPYDMDAILAREADDTLGEYPKHAFFTGTGRWVTLLKKLPEVLQLELMEWEEVKD